MRISRIHTDLALEPESELVLQGGSAHYLLRVLRVIPGQTVILFNGNGHDYVSEVVVPGKKDVRLRVLSRLPARPESPLRLTLVQALSRGERMDQTLQKSTELGVVAFQPLLTERVEVRIRPEKLKQRMEHWHKVVVSACEQCGRATIPDLNEPIGLDEWLGRTEQAQRLVLEPGSETALAKTRLGDRVELLIGPEGGFSERELATMSQNEVLAVSLGPRILRTETAGPAAIAVLQAIAGDLR